MGRSVKFGDKNQELAVLKWRYGIDGNDFREDPYYETGEGGKGEKKKLVLRVASVFRSRRSRKADIYVYYQSIASFPSIPFRSPSIP